MVLGELLFYPWVFHVHIAWMQWRATMTVSFGMLWDNHPSNRGDDHPCITNGASNFSDQCAIRFGIALERSGLSLKSFRGARCWFGHGHVLRAQEIADWLRHGTTAVGMPDISGRTSYASYTTRSGIVFFRNFWGSGNQGDHIDLWNGSRMPGSGDHSNYFKLSEEVWFWNL
ncbi:MAG: type VI secretion system amidase effector protein Tae4 [Gammaproteobacteria bacterium]|nr:type VI secretion system amidase effector protein Tae4 [Gammaproteobacteria bacterium]